MAVARTSRRRRARKRVSRSRPARSPPGGGSATSCSRPSVASDGMRPFARPGGSAGSLRGAPSDARGAAAPSQVRWKGEKTVYGRARCVRTSPMSSTTVSPGWARDLDARTASARSHALAAPPRERRDVGGDSAARRRRSPRRAPAARARAGRGGSTRPPPRSRSDASRSREALEQELRARAGGVPTVQQAVVEAEHRHDPVVRVQRGAQRGVVVDAQVAAEPDQRGHREPGPRRRRGR